MRAVKVFEDIWQLCHGRINAYLVEGEPRVLVDTGLPASGKEILGALMRLDVSPGSVGCILLTHSHTDHAGSARLLSEACQAEVYVHEADAPGVDGRARPSPLRGIFGPVLGPVMGLFEHRMLGFEPCPVRPLADGERVCGLRLVHLPGHTRGHSGFVHERTGAVLCGDAAVNWGPKLGGPSWIFTLDPAATRRSQQRLAEMDAPVYLFGHGPPLYRSAGALRALAGRR